MKEYIPQGRLLRLLQLIELMKQQPMSIIQIMAFTDQGSRTAYRYVALIKDAGFTVESKHRGHSKCYQITKNIQFPLVAE